MRVTPEAPSELQKNDKAIPAIVPMAVFWIIVLIGIVTYALQVP